jgi:hypothetical protein
VTTKVSIHSKAEKSDASNHMNVSKPLIVSHQRPDTCSWCNRVYAKMELLLH